jgi:hypothetical protein
MGIQSRLFALGSTVKNVLRKVFGSVSGSTSKIQNSITVRSKARYGWFGFDTFSQRGYIRPNLWRFISELWSLEILDRQVWVPSVAAYLVRVRWPQASLKAYKSDLIPRGGIRDC